VYIIAEKIGDDFQLDGITSDPVSYAAVFEPFDVINKLYVWDENGRKYHFEGGGEISQPQSKFISFIEVGKWDFEKNEPLLILENEEDIDSLRHILIRYLSVKPRKRKLFGKRSHVDLNEDEGVYRHMTLHELVSSAKEKNHGAD
jgi:hypothetical protein